MMVNLAQKQVALPEIWTMQEAQAKTGIGRITLMKILGEGQIKYRKIGRRYMINARSLVGYISCEEEGDDK